MTLPRPETPLDRGEETSFGEELFAELRRRRFSREGLLSFLAAAYERTRDEVYSNPSLARSTLGWGLAFFAALFVYCAGVSLSLDHDLAVASLVAGSVWLALSCAWMVVHSGMARGPSGRRIERVGIANLLTLLRSLIVPLIVVSVLRGHVVLAGVLFAVGGVSDIFDGVAARRLGQVTKMGTVMDHLVDVVFAGATFFSLVAVGLLSPWIGLLVAIRYGLVLIGGTCLCVFNGPVKIKPTTFGKFSGTILYLMILAQIGTSTYGTPELSARFSELLHIGFVVLLSSTILQALIIGWYNLKSGAASPKSHKIAGDIRWH